MGRHSRSEDPQPPGRAAGSEAAAVRTDVAALPEPDVHRGSGLSAFLFADIRGFTHYTTTRGADAAARLADRFVELAEDAVAAADGRVRGLWGDEVLAEFDSARQAVRASMRLQELCADAVLENPDLPLDVGVGLDAGEAADHHRATSGGALNVAARLCDRAAPGETLATGELAHLAGAVESVTYDACGRMLLKGAGRVTVVRVRPTVTDAARDAEIQRIRAARDPRSRGRRRRAWAAVATAAVVLAGSTTWWATRTATPAPTIPGQTVGVIDVGSGRLLGVPVPVGQSAEAVAVDGTDVWVVNSGSDSVSRINRATQAIVQTTPVGRAPLAIALTPGHAWVVDSESDEVSDISTDTNQLLPAPTPVGARPSAITADATGRYLYVTSEGANTLTRIVVAVGPDGRHATTTVDVGDAPAGVALTDDKVWVTNRADDTVSVLDHITLKPVTPPRHVGAGPRAVVSTPTGIWVANSLDKTVSHIDPTTFAVTSREVGDIPTGIAGDANSTWVSNAGDATVDRIAADGRVTGLAVGSSPHGIALADGKLFVVTQAFPSEEHRGGTLTIEEDFGNIDSIDPAAAYAPDSWDALVPVYDGLVALHRSDQTAGYQLVPDLAVALPPAVRDGSTYTYTFTLRPGIRYSDGTAVVANDFLRGLERAFRATDGGNLGGAPVYLSTIVGGTECLRSPATCSLAAGISADDRARTVTIRLTRADPDFLYALTLPFASATPPSAPDRLVTTRAFPGTGPYLISEYVPGKSLVLSRNTFFRPWSSAAQPDGYPDVIRWIPRPNGSGAAEAAVERGSADLTRVDADSVPGLLASHPTLLHHSERASTGFLILNSQFGTFRNPAARQAVALAVNRSALTRVLGWGSPTCQLVPPGWPGRPSTCAYPAQNLAKARALLADSGLANSTVSIYASPGGYADAAHLLATQLSAVGLNARVTVQPAPSRPEQFQDPRFFNLRLYTTKRPWDIQMMGWFPDFPAVGQFFSPILSCDLLDPAGATSNNVSRFCDRELQQQVDAAGALQGSDPAAAVRMWTSVYRQLDRLAPVVPLGGKGHDWLVSARVGNFTSTPIRGPDLDQMWVR
jgi:peptide/nickel transport system substrate-binding protein